MSSHYSSLEEYEFGIVDDCSTRKNIIPTVPNQLNKYGSSFYQLDNENQPDGIKYMKK